MTVIQDIGELNEKLERHVVDKYQFYFTLGIANPENVDLDSWLSNPQDEEERLLILWLANTINFISRRHFAEMLRKAVKDVYEVSDGYKTIFTPVLGERPRPSDSGNLISRILRSIGVEEDLIKSHREVLSIAERHNIVFVDDFIGSGDQISSTLYREDFTSWGETYNLMEVLRRTSSKAYYCPPIATSYGYKRALELLGEYISIMPLYVIGDRQLFSSSDSIYWPKWITSILDVESVVERICERVGLESWLGFHDLSTAIVFDHGAPDSNLRLFSYKARNWSPLIRGDFI